MSFIENLERTALRTHMRREMKLARRKKENEKANVLQTLLSDKEMFDTAYYAVKSDGRIFGDDEKRRPLLELLQLLIDNSDTILEILLRILPYIVSGEGPALSMPPQIDEEDEEDEEDEATNG